jgi:hypothetical protein
VFVSRLLELISTWHSTSLHWELHRHISVQINPLLKLDLSNSPNRLIDKVTESFSKLVNQRAIPRWQLVDYTTILPYNSLVKEGPDFWRVGCRYDDLCLKAARYIQRKFVVSKGPVVDIGTVSNFSI